jgi:hypothetical protein
VTADGLDGCVGWAHSIDDSSSNRGYTIQDSLNPAAERGDSSFDIRNRFTFAATYELAGRSGYAQLMKGWRFNSIFTAEGAEPVLFYDSFDDISGTGAYNDRWDLSGNAHNIHWVKTGSEPFIVDGTTSAACVAADPAGVSNGQLAYYGCYAGPWLDAYATSAGRVWNHGSQRRPRTALYQS